MEGIIKTCMIEKDKFMNHIYVIYEDGTEERIGSYYPDEINYKPSDFLGLTRRSAQRLMQERDIAYLQS